MRDYQRRRNNIYVLPSDLWYRTLYLIRGYDRMKEEYEDRIEEGIGIDTENVPSGKTYKNGDPTGIKAVKFSKLAGQIRAIEMAKLVVPYEYMDGVWNNIMTHDPYPPDANPRTYGRWKGRYVYEVARNMDWI